MKHHVYVHYCMFVRVVSVNYAISFQLLTVALQYYIYNYLSIHYSAPTNSARKHTHKEAS